MIKLLAQHGRSGFGNVMRTSLISGTSAAAAAEERDVFASPPPTDVRNFRSKQHCSKEWWDGVVPPWSSAQYVGRRELRGEASGAQSLGLEAFYHMRRIGSIPASAAGAESEAPADPTEEAARGEPGSAFAIVEVGAQQFKVTPDDIIYVEKLQGVDVNDIVSFGRVLMCGSASRTVVGRPYIRGASVVAAVEEQFRDGKVFVFKKKRRKNYRRFNTHRQDLTGLRILRLHIE